MTRDLHSSPGLYTIPQQRRILSSRIAELILKTPQRHRQSSSSATHIARAVPSAPRKPCYATKRLRKKGSTLLILGPLESQKAELSSSSDSEAYDSDDPPSLPEPTPDTASLLPLPLPSSNELEGRKILVRPASAPPMSKFKQGAAPCSLISEAPRSTPKINWQEYELPVEGLEEAVTCISSSDSDSPARPQVSVLYPADIQGTHIRPKESPVLDTDTLTRLLMESQSSPTPRKAPQTRGPSRPIHTDDLFSPSPQKSGSPDGIWKSHRVTVHLPTPAVTKEPGSTAEKEIETPGEPIECDSCRKQSKGDVFRMLPCQDIVCAACFSSTLAAVSNTHDVAKCGACLLSVTSFELVKRNHSHPFRSYSRDRSRESSASSMRTQQGAVMRIDNVAWDVTPDVVKAFLPPESFSPAHLHPIHILLDRRDGRTKDYMYIEVASLEAARNILQKKQNSYMPGGPLTSGRKRPVTITIVEHEELVGEVGSQRSSLRPQSRRELKDLLALCQAAVSPSPPGYDSYGIGSPYTAHSGLAHFVKFRHGPFFALMSVMSKLGGRGSTAYWDVLEVASSAMRALAHAIDVADYSYHDSASFSRERAEDQRVLDKLSRLFQACFATSSSASPPL